ncbi:MAG: hypothetical protein Q7U75_00790, partial [Desulfobacterales bacterium]|nr:hypothetical protein [Desulfobacterales bacterium]
GVKGGVAFKATLARAGILTTAVMLADIWFEAGATEIDAADIELTRREDYYRADVSGISIVAGSPKAGLQQLGAIVTTIPVGLANADLPTGANDGAHKIGLGGHASQPGWQWETGVQLNAPGDTVHDVLEKIVSDLGRLEAQGVPGSRLLAAGAVTETWADGSTVDPGIYDDTIGGYLAGMVRDLAGAAGGDKVGAPVVAGAPYALPAGTVEKHLGELLADLNDHVNTGGHVVNAILHPQTVDTFADTRVLFAALGNARWNDLVRTLGEKPGGVGSSGDMAIGCGPVSAARPFPSPVVETLTLAGNTSLSGSRSEIAYEILGRMRYNGDNRLTGVFQPENDLGATLGAVLKRFAAVYTSAVRGTTLGVIATGAATLESTGAATPATVKAEDDVVLSANFSDLTGGIIRMDLGNVEQARLSKVAFLPFGSSKSIGDSTDRWNVGYFNTHVDFGSPGIRSREINACGGFSSGPASAQPLWFTDGAYLYNGAAAVYEVYAALDFLKVGDVLESIQMDWFPTVAGNMDATLFRAQVGAGAPGGLLTINPTLGARHLTTGVGPFTIASGWRYYLRVYGAAVANQRLYGVRVNYRTYTWPT